MKEIKEVQTLEIPEKSNLGKKLFTWIFFVVVVVLMTIYWIVPFRVIEFDSNVNSNFTLDGVGEMQFYKQMRFVDEEISYRISDCNIAKNEEMRDAFDFIENLTILKFYSVDSEEEISVTCDETVQYSGNLFIAGEGGPSRIVKTSNYNVITYANILLIRDSGCGNPNVAIHELMHTLGFNHSENEDNLMYPISNCDQEIGMDMINFINEIYSQEPLPDLSFEEVDAVVEGVYLNANISVRNNGLVKSKPSKIDVYANDRFVKSFDLQELDIGVGNVLSVGHIWISKLNVNELKFVINYDFVELDKKNNERILKIND